MTCGQVVLRDCPSPAPPISPSPALCPHLGPVSANQCHPGGEHSDLRICFSLFNFTEKKLKARFSFSCFVTPSLRYVCSSLDPHLRDCHHSSGPSPPPSPPPPLPPPVAVAQSSSLPSASFSNFISHSSSLSEASAAACLPGRVGSAAHQSPDSPALGVLGLGSGVSAQPSSRVRHRAWRRRSELRRGLRVRRRE